MTRDELVELLGAHEWRDVEFKEARRAAPKDAYETVAAFANTEGGHLVFGVRGSGSDVEVVGVQDVDKVQGEFLNTLRQPRKFSVGVDVQEELHRLGDLDLLVFYIPEVSRSQKPVYLNDDIRRAFVRSGGSDVRCSANERNRFLVDAASERYDSRSVEIDPAKAFDEESLRWYRAVYEARLGNRSHKEASDLDFLAEMGLLVERGERRLPTRAAVLLFGTNPALRQLLPRPVVDCQRYSTDRDAAYTGKRWFDRLVLEDNEDEVTLSQIGLVAGVSSDEAVGLARHLVTQALFRRVGQGRYALAGHIRDHAAALGQPSEAGLVTDQAAAPKGGLVTARVTNLTEHQKTIMINCDAPRTRAELMERTGLNHRAFFRRKHLDPLVRAGLIRMTRPEEPTHPDQAYVVTESGLAFLSQSKK